MTYALTLLRLLVQHSRDIFLAYYRRQTVRVFRIPFPKYLTKSYDLAPCLQRFQDASSAGSNKLGGLISLQGALHTIPCCSKWDCGQHVGDCQNYGPFLGPYYNTGPNTGPNLGDPNRDHNFDNPPCHNQACCDMPSGVPCTPSPEP